MQALQLTLDDYVDACAKRDSAMESVAAHAEENSPGWTISAEAWLRRYAREHRQFISEECTQAAYAAGAVEEPADARAWGKIFKRVAKSGEIAKDGYGISRRRNMSPTPLWRSTVFGRSL